MHSSGGPLHIHYPLWNIYWKQQIWNGHKTVVGIVNKIFYTVKNWPQCKTRSNQCTSLSLLPLSSLAIACLSSPTSWTHTSLACRSRTKSRAASSIGNTDFLSVTDFFAEKGGKPHIFRYFSWCFIGNFPKLHCLVKTQLWWTFNFKMIRLQHDINRKQELYMQCTQIIKKCCVPQHCREMSLKWHSL